MSSTSNDTGTSTGIDEKQTPRPVHVTRADEVKTADGQTAGMIRQVS